MQTVRRSVLTLATVSKKFTRSVAVNSASVVTNDESNLKSWKEIPGPSSLPIIGQLLHFLPRGSLHENFVTTVLYDQYGPIVKIDGFFGSPSIVLLFDAEASAQILRGENWMPIRTSFQSLDYFRQNFYKRRGAAPDEPTGLISDQGDVWKKFRSTVNPILLQPKTIKLYTNSLTEVAEDMVKRMRSIRNENNMLNGNFDFEMNLWALESIGVVALGGRLNCFDPNLPQDSPARKLIQTVHDIFTTADRLDFKPNLWRYFSTPTFKKAMKLYEDQINISEYFVAKAIKEFKSKSQRSTEEKGVLEKLLEINEKVAVIMASDMLFAGVDTASNTMTGTLYLLAKNPDKQKKLREEILSEKEKRPYLKACIKESMRMMPVVAGNLRVTTKEYNILGYKIPKGTHVSFVHQALSNMEKHFPEPEKYIPERWITEKTDPLFHGNAHPFAWNPFGFGVRMCIGRRIAELEIETFLAKVIENFEVEWFGPPLQTRPSSLNYTAGPYNFIFKDVKK
ncbi:cytochrome P450 CYP12A2 isoform X1 [Bicyclus anynana]|uniref:Cytochrome P450 CYP12A2 isoform X1 n=1 Tax=Bicyclus anynana TaxID=110368 RepID=A0A6J1P1G8_BICAN|nr:cytochrome P450 CYP12A2 isoform X1 [Bicyclus anynana]